MLFISALKVDQKDYHEDTGRLRRNAEFCGGQVAINKYDISRMTALCSSQSSPSLVLFGFKKMRTLFWVNTIECPLLACCNDNRGHGSIKALYNLYQSMMKKDVYAIGELQLRTSTSPRLAAVVPQQDLQGCFQIIQLPFQEEVNYIPPEDVVFADKTQVDVADDMLSRWVISLRGRQFQSILEKTPHLGHFFNCLEPASLGEGLVRPHDTIFTMKETVTASAKKMMEKFAMSLPKCEGAESNRKRKHMEENICEVVKKTSKALDTCEMVESDGEVEFLGTSTTQNLLASDVQSMKVKDIKRELDSYRISTALMIEKDDLVKALVSARKGEHDYRAMAHLKYQQQQATSLHRQSNNYHSSSTGYHLANQEGTTRKLNTKQTQAYNMAIKEGKNIFITGPGEIMPLSLLLDCMIF